LTAYQALIFLVQKGFASEARATCRNILEVKFKLAYLLKEPEAAILLIAKGEQKRAERLRDMKAGKLPVSEGLKGQDWDAVIAQAERNVGAHADCKLSPRHSLWSHYSRAFSDGMLFEKRR